MSTQSKIKAGLISAITLTLIGGTLAYANTQTVHEPAKTNTLVSHKTARPTKMASSSSASGHNNGSSIASDSSSESSQTSVDSSSETNQTPVASSSEPSAIDNTDAEQVPRTSDPAPVQTASSVVEPEPAQDTSGFNFAGYHFPIASFAGTGQVPADNKVYQWASDSRWFLIEQCGMAGHVIKANVGMGSAVTVNGRTYHVTDMVSGLGNVDGNAEAGSYYTSHIGQHAIGFQTCDSVGVLTLWFAD